MPVSMVTLECPCCGREMEVIAVGSAHTRTEFEPARRSVGSGARRVSRADRLGSVDGDAAMVGDIQGVRSAE